MREETDFTVYILLVEKILSLARIRVSFSQLSQSLFLFPLFFFFVFFITRESSPSFL